jgi:hypothetical protein
LFHLANELGMTVAELTTKADAYELMEWWAYFVLKAEDRKKIESRQAKRERLLSGFKQYEMIRKSKRR